MSNHFSLARSAYLHGSFYSIEQVFSIKKEARLLISPPAAGRFCNKKWLKAESPALSHLKSKQLFYKLYSRYFSANPSRNAFPATSPMTRYLLCTGSKMMGCSRSGAIFPSSPMILSSALTLTISPTNLQVSGS